ncbi:MAG: extracellular solute-binding protein [Lachnospiraceae bacterium]|nr:extracellular solute-binding protein [Lachnospiraceae bacterium]
MKKASKNRQTGLPHRVTCLGALGLAFLMFVGAIYGTGVHIDAKSTKEDVITLRVCNWEEYMDLGDWDEEETIDLESGDIYGERALYQEFEDWYYEHYGKRVKVEYSCFGTNEELYNMLTLGDEFDLVCPSEYMIMKLLAEDWLVPYSEDFYDESNPANYYIRNVSPYIRNVFETNEIGGIYWNQYAAGYMWGITGLLYNPEEVSEEQVSTWAALSDPELFRQVTIKDNVRDAFFAAVGAVKSKELTSQAFVSDPDYPEHLADEMNDVSAENIARVLDYLQDVKDNVYSFETDSGKADMVTGKVLANLQWSGDAVYAMDQAEEDELYLNFSVPKECTNLWFDGWVMLKNGIAGDADKQQAAEAFVNFLSIPENAVRNMYYIGYTSVIAGGEDGDEVWEYLDWTYGAEEEEEEIATYDVSYFFAGGQPEAEETYLLTVPEEQTRRQLYAQYPQEEVMERSAIMRYFDAEANAAINQMWISVRCYNILDMPTWGWILVVLAVFAITVFLIYSRRERSYEIKEKKQSI